MKSSVKLFELNKLGLLVGLGFFAFLMANSANANTPKTFTKQEQTDLMEKGMWYDERTGLIWSRCSLGQTWNNGSCQGSVTYSTRDNIKASLEKYSLGGMNNWTLPTIAELHTIIRCNSGFKDKIQIPLNTGNINIAHICAERPINGVSKVDTSIFPNNMVGSWYLSSTPMSNGNFYSLSTWSGSIGTHKESYYAIRPVNNIYGKSLEIFYKNLEQEKEQAKAKAEQKEKDFIASLKACGSRAYDEKAGITVEDFGNCDKVGTDEFLGLILFKQGGKYFDLQCRNGSSTSYDGTGKRLVNGFETDKCWKALHLIPNACELDRYRGQCDANKQPNGVGYQYRSYSAGIGNTNHQIYRGMFKDGKRNGFGSWYELQNCGFFGCGGSARSGGAWFKDGEMAYDDCSFNLKECESKPAREAEQARKEQEAYDKKVANFRKNLKVGDDATAGMVIEIKGDLVKIQTNDRQCSQKDYDGKCMNYVNTPVEKWVKRRDLYPAD